MQQLKTELFHEKIQLRVVHVVFNFVNDQSGFDGLEMNVDG